MDIAAFMATETFRYIVIPILIFCSRIIDVSVGTIRVIFISKGYKLIAPVLGFVEVMIWLLAIQQIMNNLTSAWTYLAYGLGFATGTFVGMIIEERIQIGKVVVRVIAKENFRGLIRALRAVNYNVTVFYGNNNKGKVKLLFSIIERRDLSEYLNIVEYYNPKATYSIEDVRYAYEGYKRNTAARKFTNIFGLIRKAK